MRRRRRRRLVSSPMHADRLVVVHHDDRETEYEDVHYWPWRDGVSILDADGVELVKHEDVLRTVVGAPA
jgi:hypothetical protein